MPNWKKVIVSGSDATLNSLLVSSNIAIGTSSLGSSENTLVIGPAPAGGTGEGGQLLLQAPNSGGFTSASMLDNWQNSTRLLRGSNQSSDAVVTQWNMHTKQVSFPAYNSVSAFVGTAVANLAVDSGGNILTVSTSGGTVFPYTGVAAINGGLVVTGSITASSAIHAQANGTMYFRGGDDAELWDINVANTIGVYGQQDQGVASIKLGSGGGTISGRSGSIGIGTITPNSASLHVSGNVFATSFTGSLLGNATTASYVLQAVSASFATTAASATTASYILNAVSASFASTASSADNFTVRNTLTATTIVVQTITSSVDFVTGSTRFGSLTSNTHLFTGSVSISGSLTVVGAVSASSFTGSLLGTAATASFVTTAQTASFVTTAQTASFVTTAQTASYILQAVSASFATTAAFASNANLLDGLDSTIFATTGSNTFRGNQTVSGSLTVTGSISLTGSLGILGAISASSFTGSYTGSLTGALTGTSSWATSASNAISAAFASNANLLDGLDSTIFATTSSNTFRGDQIVTGSVTISGSAATELTVRGEQVNTGSLTVSGSLTVNSSTITVNTNGDSRVFASTFRPVGATGQNIYVGHAGTTNTFSAGNDASFNTSVGVTALDSNTRGNLNTAVGWSAASAITTGIQNTAVGALSLNNSLTNNDNTAVGYQTITNADGFQNTALGSNAGSNITGFITSSIYIGYNASGLNAGGLSGQTNNEIVIGANTTGLGSNTVVLGNGNITTTILRGKVGIGTTAPTVALDINLGSIKAGTNTATEGTVILQDYYTAGNLTNFGTNRSSGGPVISYASIPSPTTAYNFTSTFSSPAGRSAIILEDRISFYTTASQTVASGSAIGIAERVRIADTGQLSFFRYTATSSFPGTVAAVLAVDSSGNVITTAASGSAGGGGGTPGGANTTIQFNDSNTFSGSGNFTFTKSTNTVRIQASGSALLVISGSQGELLRVQDSGSSPSTLATISSGSVNVFTFTSSSLLVTGSVNANIETDALHYGRIVVTPATNQDNYAPTGWNDTDPAKATTINISAGASIKITGLAGGQAGRVAVLKNTSPDRLIILEDSSSASTTTNRFDFRNPIFLLPNGSATLLYDGVDSLWQPMGTSGGIGFGAFFDTYDDFIGAVSTFSTTATEVGRFAGIGAGTGAGGGISNYLVNTTEKPLGVYRVSTGTGTTGRAILGSTDGASVIPANGQAMFLCRIAVETLSTATDEYQIFAGFQDSVGTTTVTDGVFWEYRRGSSTAWQGATANNTTITRTGAAGPTVDTNYIWLGIYLNSTWTRATYFYSQDSLTWTIAGEITTNLPTAARSTGLGVTINKTAGTTSRSGSIDLMAYRYDLQRG